MKKVHLPWPEGMKKTKQRANVLSVLERSASPMSAMEICKQTEEDNRSVWLSTVYRILQLFVERNVVIKTSIADSDMALYELNRNQHRHYAVCLKCHKIVEIDNCPMEQYIPRLADDEFKILGHKFEMYGYCKNCMEKE